MLSTAFAADWARGDTHLSRATFCGRIASGSRTRDVDHRGSQVTRSTDDRSSIAKAYQWATRIMVVSLEMVLPGLAGYWLDQQLGTKVLFMLAGFGLGSTAAVVHLIRMVRAEEVARRK
jgi:F0F1-type ATP synthase assembly protein I